MIPTRLLSYGKMILLGCFAVAAVLYGTWTTTEFVMAYRELKRAHIFPTVVTAAGWHDYDRVRAQDLSEDAPFASFTKENSAYITLAEEGASKNAPVSPESSSHPVSETQNDSDTPAGTTSDGSVGGDAPTVSNPASPSAEDAPQNQENNDPLPTVAPAPAAAPDVVPVTESAPTSFLQQVIALTADHMRARAAWALTSIARTALATTTDSSESTTDVGDASSAHGSAEEVSEPVTSSPSDDAVPSPGSDTPFIAATSTDAASSTVPADTVTESLGTADEIPAEGAPRTYALPPQADAFASCAVSGGNCYILELSGFSVDGALTAKTFKKAELNFSFANLTGEGAIVDDKLAVRYFHEGRWHSAGEIYLNKEISNASNGGYFTSTLEGIDAWDDLSDVKVVIEYEHASGKSAELYMDAAWIDTIYQDPASDVFNDHTDNPMDVGDNVTFDLAQGGIETPTLVLGNGDRIMFPYTDDVDEDQLAMFADKESYRGVRGADESVAYVSVTNTTSETDTFRLLAAFPDGNGAIREIAQYLRNVPGETETPMYEDVTYLCEGGWEQEVKSQKSEVKSASQNSESEEQETGEEREKEKDEIETERSKTESGEQTVSATSTGELRAGATSTEGEVKSQKSKVKNTSEKSESVEQTARADEEVENTEVITTDETENEKSETRDDAAAYVCAATGQVEPCASLSETGENCLVPHVAVGVEKGREYTSAWVPSEASSAPQDASGMISSMPPGYRIAAATENSFDILPNQTVYFRITLDASVMKGGRQFVLYAKGASLFGDLDSALLRDAVVLSGMNSADQKLTQIKKKHARVNERVSARTDFDGDEMPEFRFKFTSQKPLISRLAYRLLNKKTFEVEHARLRRMDARDEDVPVDIEYAANGEWTLALKKHPRAFRPGKYAIELTIAEGSQTYTDTVDFYWGVLAINSNKSLYEPNETAYLSMAALDDNGSTICDADLRLTIADPAGASHDVPVRTSGVCGPDNVVDVPDYSADFALGAAVGTYTMTLEERDADGVVIHRITDAFEVGENVAFVVERVGPTRIYPKAPYTMDIAITARHAFSGTVTEAIPIDTLILEKDGGSLSQYGDALRLSWGVDLVAGETKHFRYTFDAPDRSPYLYVFGPLEMKNETSPVFTELRTWKVASDALGTYAEKSVEWSPTTAAAWQTKDLSGSPFNVPANAVLEIAIVNSDTANERQGGVRHASSSLSRIFDIQEAEPQGVTETIMHVQASATSSIQTYAEDTTNISFVLLGYWTSGYYVERFQQIDPGIANATWGNINLSSYGVADGNVVEMVLGNWNTVAENNAGVRRLGSALNRYANIHESESNGINTATMLVKASTTNATIQGYAQIEGTNNADVDYWLAGYWSVNPTGIDYTERFDDLGGPASASTWTDRRLDSYGVPPTGIANVLFANIADANSSMLIGVRTNGSTVDRSQNLHEAEAGGWVVGSTHVLAGSDASSTIEYLTEDTASDVFRLLGYWSAGNYPPNAPTLYDIPFESEKTGTSTPKFRFSATDPDGTSSIVYQIQWDDDAVLDDSPLGDESSDADAGFANITTPADTSPFNEGDQVEYTVQSSLVSGTTYYWRVRATDVSGSNISSEWSDVKSFTYVANTNPAQWFQTQDTQFEQGILSNTETYGSNAVRIVTAAPTGAIIAYGEGTVQTPRYRTWSGSAWGAESSAQSVGGTIQWMRMAAGATRNEYVLGTQDDVSDVNVQVYNGTAGTWGNLQEMTTTISNTTRRGFDVAYETTSGDAIAVYCDGDADPSYRVWNGTSWSAATTINLSSAANCEWIQLTSDPTSDEIVLVARDTGAQYEAQVWDGSTWGNSQTLGSMNQPQHEGIAVNYEESGEQAVVAVSNGTNANFIWTAWNGTEWSVPTTQGLNDDFEWGVIKRDNGSDSLALCYIDEDSDLGLVRWDGDAWQTYQEFDTGGNNDATGGTPEGRPISCEFETTSGRDGYIMLPYSDTAAARYRYWDGATLSAEASISTIEDSWTVGSVRTGDGKILSYFHDDVNSRYDFSYWNGSSWATAQTLENTPSVTVTPFREPIAMVAQKYQSLSGTITSDPVAFSLVPGRQTWGEALWNVTEPAGTAVYVQVMSGSACTTTVSEGSLPGNTGNGGMGFAATSSPVDLSSLSTTTYSQLCLKATLTSTSQNNPTLNDWSLSWVRRPYLTQVHYRWYANAASATVSDAWPSGGDDVGEDTAIPASFAPSPGDVLRLRMGVLDENVSLSSSALSLRLQYAEGVTCSASLTWRDVGAIGSTTAKWRGYDNGSVSDGATLPSTVLASSTVAESYEEANDSSLNPNSVATNGVGEWDWVIQHNASSSVNYCFRVMTGDNELLNAYDVYPSLITNSAPNTPVLEKLFDNEMVASTTPWFEFVAEDPDGDDMTYQVQVSTGYDFATTTIDRNSQTNFSEFTNTITPSDKDPFTTGQTMRFIPTSALTSGTTYYWRVRAKDRNKSAEWGSWSEVRSFTINTGTVITSWHQTRMEQFATGDLTDTEATSTHEVVLTPPLTTGTTTSSLIDFDWKSTGNAWGELSWTDTEAAGIILYHIEYWTGAEWELIPDSVLAGNAVGLGSSPVSLLSLDPTTYNQIRIRANFTSVGATPHLLDWTVRWGEAVEQPTQYALFDNEKTGTTTPTFTFMSTDPQGNDLVYEISWSTSPNFTSSTTRISSTHVGFANTASSTDTSPFFEGDRISFTVQSGDALTNGQTYWWRVRAIDPGGGNTWSVWSTSRSFTVDTSVNVSTWFQTTDDQFNTDTLTDIETTGSGSMRVTTTNREAFMAYAEGTAQVPRFRLWNGTSWGTEQSALSIGDTIRFVETAAAPTRDEYIIATMGSTGVIDAQVYNGTTDTAGNSTELSYATNMLRRGFDVAYETTSGDALAVSCFGTEATYRVWNGTSWTASSTITLAVSGNCEWVKLAADPTSDEIILVVRDTAAGATDYQALVWNGSSWGNSMTMGSQVTVSDEGISVEYEESGGQAIVAVSNGANNNFIWNAWNGSAWSGTNTVTIGNDFAGGRIVRDSGSDEMAMCYIDIDGDVGFVEWSGSAWGTFNEFETLGNSFNARPVSCEYETTSGRDNYVMIPYSDTTQAESLYWNGSVLSSAAILSTITDSWEIRTARTGDGNILMVAYDDANTEYDFSYWNGTSWSTEVVIETNSIPTLTPATIPLDIVARRYPAFNSGSVVSSAIDFDDGLGPKWGSLSWNDTTLGSSDITYQIEYLTSTSSWELIPDAVLPYNSVGTSTGPVSLSSVNRTTYNQIRLKANFQCVSGQCPTLSDWTLAWSEGIAVSGTIQEYDQATNVLSGTVAIAVNGVVQTGKTGTVSNGTWTIPNVTVFTGDIVTIFVDGANDTDEAVAVTSYTSDGNDITGVKLYERHVTLGSDDNPTLTNANLGEYDVTDDEDVFFDIDAGNDLAVCPVGDVGCFGAELWIKNGTTYRPDSASSGNVSTAGIEINGTLVADGNTITVNGSWDNNGTFTPGSGTVIFAATSTTETIDSTSATSSAFNNVTFGTSGAATWNLASAFDVNGNLTLSYGTLSQGAHLITMAGNLTINANGQFTKGTASTTFDGTGTSNWTDNAASKQDMGNVVIDGTAKTMSLGSGVKATNITIGVDDTLDVNNNYALEVTGNWTNNNVFTARSGTVTFSATDTGHTIAPGNSSFYNLTFNGVGGNWAFSGSAVGVTNDFTIANGDVTLLSGTLGTTTIGGSFANTGGTFAHNNGAIVMNSAAAKTLQPGSSSFYDLAFNGSGSWSFVGSNATTSRNFTITQGSVTLPSGTLAIAGSLINSGGSFTHNSGTVKMTSSGTQTIRPGASSFYNLTTSGAGSWSFWNADIIAANTMRFENGTTTLPSGTFSVGGSWTRTGGTFAHNNGTVLFNSTDLGETITPGNSPFYNLTFNGVGGGWTIAANATSTNNTTLTAGTFTLTSGATLEVDGTFTNAMPAANTTWTGSTLYLNSGTNYTINSKTVGGEVYGTLSVGANTDVRMWNSSSTVATVNSTASLYSQNHASTSGSLYIWGDYARSTGNDYWSYATDFDGAALGASSRQVNVRIASGSTVTSSGGILNIVGGVGATTTIANQGSGTYAFNVSGGTLTAQYYSVRNTGAAGLNITGTPTINSLADGDFELGTNGSSLITVASTVIDAAANQALQIQRVRFATSTGVTTGANVTETGDATSYWWFRNHTGSFSGENYDADTGNPGDIRWDNSSLTITVSGHVYADHGGAVSTVCNGSSPVVRIVTSLGNSYTGSCAASDGAYNISGVAVSGDIGLTVYLDTNGGRRAVTVTKTPIVDISGVDLYENVLSLRHEDTAPITIADLARYDSSDDSDVFFTAVDAVSDTLTVAPENELYVTSGKTFAPAGNVTLQSGGSGDARDGRLYIAASGAFTAAGTESHAIGGGFWIASGASFVPASSTITFTATTTGKVINASSTLSFYDVAFTGVGGGWAITSPATTTITHSISPTAGTLSGTGDIRVSAGGLSGAGTIAMTGGLIRVDGDVNFGNTGSTAWQVGSILFGDGVATTTTTKVGTGTTTVTGVLTISAKDTLNAGTAAWVLSGSGTPLVEGGTTGVLNAQSAPFYFTSTGAVTVADATYYDVYFAPSAAGTPTYTLQGGTLAARHLTVGGTYPVSVTANANDPSVNVTGNVSIGTGSTLIASNVGSLSIGGSWNNDGTFTHSNAAITFNSADAGETIAAGVSPFYDVTFTNGGGWTLTESATTTRNLTLTGASDFIVSPGITVEVDGAFANNVGGGATTWTNSTLYLNSGTNYSINSTTTADVYGTLMVGANTDIRMWNSSAATTTVNSSGSLYSQDHANVNGSLYIWGEYVRSSGSDYWSYDTDFDGTTIASSPRQVDVRIASSSSLTFSGGVLDIIGASTASTTIQNQGAGRYSFSVSGGTFTATNYVFRHLTAAGLNFSGTPTISSLSSGDLELDVTGGSLMTVAGSVITQNPLKIFTRNRFATSSTAATGYNVTTSGTTDSSWKFNLHYGGLDGENYDADPDGAADPGFVRWDNSATAISISGHVYSDEGSTVNAAVCTGASNIRLMIQGANPLTTSCDSGTGLYTFSGVSFNPGDTLTVYIDGVANRRAANVTVDPVTTIANMDLYENRVIVRHEDTAPITIAKMAVYDSSDDTDVPFTAVDAGSDTLTLPPNTKLIVWDGKTFAPAGEVTLQSGGSGAAYDGTLELRTGAVFTAANTQTHSIGGDLTVGSGSSINAASSTFNFTATTTGKTITLNGSNLYNMTFSGSGGNWAFAGANGVTALNDFTISAGTVTLSSATTTVGGSFQNTGGTFMHNNGTLSLVASSTGKSIRVNGSSLYNLIANNANGGWNFVDTSATSSGSVTITAGAMTLPSTNFSVGGSFLNYGTFASAGAVKLTAATAGKEIRAGNSSFYDLTFNGIGGEWTFLDTSATTTHDFTLTNGSTTLPSVTLSVGSSFVNTGTFYHNMGLVRMYATSTGKSITASTSPFYDLTLNSSSGGWTITGNATTTRNFTLSAASSFTLASSATLEVDGTFTNSVGGAATTWTNSTLFLNSGTSYSINTRSSTGDMYNGTLRVGTSTDVRVWYSAATTTTVDSSGSLYSQDHANIDGSLYIWGDYARSSGTDYWSRATDFDGTALGSPRQVNVYVASSSAVTYSSGATLNMTGTAAATTTVQVQGTGRYDFALSGGTINASYYAFRNLNTSGLNISGSSVITAMNNGDFELDLTGGSMISVTAAAIDANASKIFTSIRFATSTGITSGYNVTVSSGSTNNFWTFTGTLGNFAGESHDSDGADACGNIRWQDSSCLLVNQAHYRWRADDGGEGAPDSEWYNASWSKRKKVAITNSNTSGYTNLPVKITVAYDSDMQADFDDLRFTNSSGTTSLDYWIEEVTPSDNAIVWVEVPTIYAEDAADVYMYYGNSSATDGSNDEATFPFFDGFEDGDINEYVNNTDRSNRFTVRTGPNKHGTYGLDAYTTEDQFTSIGLIYSGSLTSNSNTIRYFQYVDANFEDEPCTLFGVQGNGSSAPTQDYGVCLDQYNPATGNELVELVKDVESNDSSGSVMSSQEVTFATGWYEVIINWVGSSIDVSVYNEAGSLFATTSTTTSAYSSGGIGFSYWGQNGAWDSYMVKPYTASDPTYIFGAEQGSGGASWLAAVDTAYTGASINENIRLRFSIQNTGAQIPSEDITLQYVAKGSALNCESVTSEYTNVPVEGSCGGHAACMASSTNITDQGSTAGLLAYPSWMSYTYGKVVEYLSNNASNMTVDTNYATEVEYNFRLTSSATGNAYCFRTVRDGNTFDSYAHVAEVVIAHEPTIQNLFFSTGNSPIALTEGTSTTIYATGTIEDLNGYQDISFATSTMFRSGVSAGPMCVNNVNNCYQIPSSSCALSNCAGTTCDFSCSANIAYVAEPTDVGTYASETWLATLAVRDTTGLYAMATSSGVELLSMYGLALDTSAIDFDLARPGGYEPGQNSGAVNIQTGLINTGNTEINIQVAGTDMAGSADTVPVGSQVYATSTFTFGSCAICNYLSTSTAAVDVDLPKPTSTSTAVTDDLYWGIGIPMGVGAADEVFMGTNTFIAVGG